MVDRVELRSLKLGLKALALLNEIDVMSVSELARQLALPRTTAERILRNLASEGYVHRVDEDKGYRLSIKASALATGLSDKSWLTDATRPLLFDFTERSGWPLAIATPDGTAMALCLTTYSATSRWLTRRRIGERTPMLNSSAGLVYLAFSPREQQQLLLECLQGPGKDQRSGLMGHGHTSQAILQRVRADGHAFDPTDVTRECSLSVPFLIDGEVRAVLMMMFMTMGLSRRAVAAHHVPALEEIAASLAAIAQGDGGVPEFAGLMQTAAA